MDPITNPEYSVNHPVQPVKGVRDSGYEDFNRHGDPTQANTVANQTPGLVSHQKAGSGVGAVHKGPPGSYPVESGHDHGRLSTTEPKTEESGLKKMINKLNPLHQSSPADEKDGGLTRSSDHDRIPGMSQKHVNLPGQDNRTFIEKTEDKLHPGRHPPQDDNHNLSHGSTNTRRGPLDSNDTRHGVGQTADTGHGNHGPALVGAGAGAAVLTSSTRRRGSSPSPSRLPGMSGKNPNVAGQDNRTFIEKAEDKLHPGRHAPQDDKAYAGHAGTTYDNRTAAEKARDKLDPRIDSDAPYNRQTGTAHHDNRTTGEKVYDKIDPRIDSTDPAVRQRGTGTAHDGRSVGQKVHDKLDPTRESHPGQIGVGTQHPLAGQSGLAHQSGLGNQSGVSSGAGLGAAGVAAAHHSHGRNEHETAGGVYDDRTTMQKVQDKVDPRVDSSGQHRTGNTHGTAGTAGTHGTSGTYGTHGTAGTAGAYDNRTVGEKVHDKVDPRIDSDAAYARHTGTNQYDDRTTMQKVQDKLDPRVDSGARRDGSGVGTGGALGGRNVGTHNNNNAGLGHPVGTAGAYDNRTVGEKIHDKVDPRVDSDSAYARQAGTKQVDNRTTMQKVQDKVSPGHQQSSTTHSSSATHGHRDAGLGAAGVGAAGLAAGHHNTTGQHGVGNRSGHQTAGIERSLQSTHLGSDNNNSYTEKPGVATRIKDSIMSVLPGHSKDGPTTTTDYQTQTQTHRDHGSTPIGTVSGMPAAHHTAPHGHHSTHNTGTTEPIGPISGMPAAHHGQHHHQHDGSAGPIPSGMTGYNIPVSSSSGQSHGRVIGGGHADNSYPEHYQIADPDNFKPGYSVPPAEIERRRQADTSVLHPTTTTGLNTGDPSIDHADIVRSSGFKADGGDFDAAKPGAGQEAARLQARAEQTGTSLDHRHI
jgi:hypothetical protein